MVKIALPFTEDGRKYEKYEEALSRCGMEPVEILSEDDIPLLDGLLLPGGADVNPARYGEENTASLGIDDGLDALQFTVLDKYVNAGKPVFGICRGHQLINVFFGGTLHQNIDAADSHRKINGVEQFHGAVFSEGSLLERLYSCRTVVNSSHHQGVKIPGEGLEITALADDGTVEGIAHRKLKVIGVQWHPERMLDRGGDKLFHAFRSAAEETAGKEK